MHLYGRLQRNFRNSRGALYTAIDPAVTSLLSYEILLSVGPPQVSYLKWRSRRYRHKHEFIKKIQRTCAAVPSNIFWWEVNNLVNRPDNEHFKKGCMKILNNFWSDWECTIFESGLYTYYRFKKGLLCRSIRLLTPIEPDPLILDPFGLESWLG